MKTMMILIACLFLVSCGLWKGDEGMYLDAGEEPDVSGQDEVEERAPPGVPIDDLPGASMDPSTMGMDSCACSSESILRVVTDGAACYFIRRPGCSSHSDCDDGVYCNTEERCGMFGDGQTACYVLCCSCNPCTGAPDAACHPGVCSEEQRACAYPLKDSDGDGYADRNCEGGVDCDDSDASVHPGAAEACDGRDNDCDDTADEDAWSAAPQPTVLTDGTEGVQDADAAPLGGGWVVAWSRGAGAGLRIGMVDEATSSPPVPESTPLTGTEGAGEVEVIATGAGEIVLLWVDGERTVSGKKLIYSGGEFQEQASAVIFDDVLPDPAVQDLELAEEPDGRSAAAFFRSQDSGNDEIYMVRFSLSSFGAADIAAPVRLTHAIGFSGYPSAAAGDGFYAVAWEDMRDGNKEVYLSMVDVLTMLPGDEKRITFAPGDSRYPTVAGLPGGFLVAWIDDSMGSFNVMAAQLDAVGDPVSYPAAMEGAQGAAAGAFAAPDSRDPDFSGQALIAYSAAAGQERKLYLTAVSAQSPAIQPGMEIRSTRSIIEQPVLSGTGNSRALIWIERSYSASDLYFLVLGCPPL